jgi:hypothetical protein
MDPDNTVLATVTYRHHRLGRTTPTGRGPWALRSSMAAAEGMIQIPDEADD